MKKTNYIRYGRALWQMVMTTAVTVLVLYMLSCASSQERAERKALMQKAVTEAVVRRQMHIDVRSMSTLRYGSRMTSFGFFLELKGDSLNSCLPYMGQVYRASMLSTSQGLNFEAPILSYVSGKQKAHMYRIAFQTKSQEDTYEYIIELYDSGKADIRVVGHIATPSLLTEN